MKCLTRTTRAELDQKVGFVCASLVMAKEQDLGVNVVAGDFSEGEDFILIVFSASEATIQLTNYAG